ncbi:MFS transporter [Mycetocola zhadangensis]|uniref:DHA2 family efflux MFS transporter permease subunit n=1 Tax=Mycetocola zhadangensis TaxID=1164595 RepID=A0A3L7J5W0_9MICO|nr:MFS transporter [Mycetocola zhadangensis]RLQ83922.1 DHA2 family efflux MFS transporter permease subunit [Mycetocola zhadangensis]GGE97685.1 MFS transporter [Mycetocola zhadangensis]
MASAPRTDSATQRIVLLVAILASFVAFLDGTIINVALPAITREFGGGLPVQQWVVDAYLLTLGAFILLAGSLSDAFGRVRILAIGLVGFGATSLLCAIAPSAEFLIFVRALQGATAALLVPSSLAIIISTFSGQAQARAIGTWTAWTGTAMIVGPLIGGLLVDTVSWRLVFGINVIPIAVTLVLLTRMGKDPERTTRRPRVDVIGAILGAIGLGGPVFALIEQARFGWTSPVVWVPLLVGVIAFAAFLWWEGRTRDPMMPLSLFESRNFSAGNIATVFIYGALGLGFFVIAIYLQQVAGWPATLAGIATLPPTLVMLFLSSRIGAWAGRVGPRMFMTVGPIVGGLGFLLMLAVDSGVNYWLELLPGLVIFGIGLSITVAPLTSAILGAIDESQAGIGSAINNAVARVAGLVAVACAGLILGTVLDLAGFHRAMIATAIAMILGGVISFVGIRNPTVVDDSPVR